MSKYFFNERTLQYEEVKTPLRIKIARGAGIFCAILVSGLIIHSVADILFPSQREEALKREIDEMAFQYDVLLGEVADMSAELERIQDRDAQVHRFMFDIDPIDESVWSAGIGGTDELASLRVYPNAGEVMAESFSRASRLKRQLVLQSASLDTIETLAKQRAEKLQSIPSIKPVRVDLLARNVTMLSGFGRRLHPIHKVHKMHEGLDFTAPKGTAIQATGAGKVIAVRKSKSGYGRHIIIDHGFDGFQTLYAHLDELHVKVGDKVQKGQQIGTVGSTGTSTAPHCHYEVRINGRAVDPIHYCLDGLTAEQYEEIVKRASSASISFD